MKRLTKYDLPDQKWVPDGYDMTEEPIVSDANFAILMKEHNALVDAFNELLARLQDGAIISEFE